MKNLVLQPLRAFPGDGLLHFLGSTQKPTPTNISDMKTVLFTSFLVVAFSVAGHAQNLRFWTQNRMIEDRCVVNIYAGHMKSGAETELLQGVNLRYYYESDELQYESFVLSSKLLASGFHTFGGSGNNEFSPGDLSQHGTADRFVAHAPFALDGGIQLKPGQKVLLATITFLRISHPDPSVIHSYLVGTNIFRAVTYSGLTACQDGCPFIVIAPPRPLPLPLEFDFQAERYLQSHSHLSWSVRTPDEIHQFIIERMIGDTNWEQVSTLQADGQYVHVYVDENAYENLVQRQTISYRVRAIQVSDELMSDTKHITFDSQKRILDVYPNPASDIVQVTMTETETEATTYLEIYSTDGKLTYRNALQQGVLKEEIDLAAANIQSGSYTVHLISGREILDVRPLHIIR